MVLGVLVLGVLVLHVSSMKHAHMHGRRIGDLGGLGCLGPWGLGPGGLGARGLGHSPGLNLCLASDDFATTD